MAYAGVGDLEARWRTLSEAEAGRAEVLLEDAAVRLDAVCPPSLDPTDTELAVRLIVSCEMVKRALLSSGVAGGAGATSVQQGAGPYQETVQYANPTGDLYLTKADKALLGCGSQEAFTVPMSSSPSVAPDWWVTL